MGTVRERYGERLELRYGNSIGVAVAVWDRWDEWVWYTGAVWEQFWSGGMGSGVKRYGRKVADDALSDIFFKI